MGQGRGECFQNVMSLMTICDFDMIFSGCRHIHLMLRQKIVIACIVILSFLRRLSIIDSLFLKYDNEKVELENKPTNASNVFGPSDQVFMQ
ncbi:hypothetical protein CISIN_1g041148mg [Citrus sinensis]|uniref:Uncharacterized protein n=1 Tax=Citrus sinensis TaxID=2711 RepID=A0A067FAZ4_CITSI|nr:hypothetical protein CISIN_1g041148mg [Citrus sinensis]